MKKLLVGTVGLMALGVASVPASAADLAARPVYKAPPPIVNPLYDWSGFYVGINGGWAQQRDCRSDIHQMHHATAENVTENVGVHWQCYFYHFGARLADRPPYGQSFLCLLSSGCHVTPRDSLARSTKLL